MWERKEFKDFEVALRVEGWRSRYGSVQRLLDHLKRKTRSETSRVKYLQELHRFLKSVGVGEPDVLVEWPKEKVEGALQEFVDKLADEGMSIRYVNTLIADLRLFFKVNGFKNGREIEVERYHQPARYRKRAEYIPTKEEVFSMAESCGSSLSGLRDKAMILCMYGSGLRNSTLRALRYVDVKDELEKNYNAVRVPVYPEMKKLVPGACKGDIPYFTFFPSEALRALKGYLEERRLKYGGVPDEAPLFHTEDTKIKKELRNITPLTKDSLAKIVKSSARRANIESWKAVYPHCIRKASESLFRGRTSTGIPLDVKTQEFFMGHILPRSQDTYFDKTKIEEMRKVYSTLILREGKEEAELSTLKVLVESGGLDLSRPNVKQYLIQKLGINDMEIKVAKMKDGGLGEYEASTEIICRRLGIEPFKMQTFRLKTDGGDPQFRERSNDTQRLVEEKELEKHLREGWRFVSVLPSHKILIRK